MGIRVPRTIDHGIPREIGIVIGKDLLCLLLLVVFLPLSDTTRDLFNIVRCVLRSEHFLTVLEAFLLFFQC